MRHAIIDSTGLVSNVILWDGKADYDPGDGLTLVPVADDSPIGPGDTIAIKKGTPEVTKKAEPKAPEPTVEDRIAALEAKAK